MIRNSLLSPSYKEKEIKNLYKCILNEITCYQ